MKGSKNMFSVKRNQVFKSALSDSRIRVREVTKNPYDIKNSLVKVVNINSSGQAIKNTSRVILHDSIRRRYHANY